ncbi:MAG: hypothetical protein QM733_11410 [Ilumatobacteraceae bacterium]
MADQAAAAAEPTQRSSPPGRADVVDDERVDAAVVRAAYRVARSTHEGQRDALGRPLLDHVVGVASLARARLGAFGAAVGLLHDVIEKGGATRESLEADGIHVDVLDAVDLLTQAPGENVHCYLDRCASDPRAAIVKECDLVEKIAAADPFDGTADRLVGWGERLTELRRKMAGGQFAGAPIVS